jgi:hypothetical protein
VLPQPRISGRGKQINFSAKNKIFYAFPFITVGTSSVDCLNSKMQNDKLDSLLFMLLIYLPIQTISFNCTCCWFCFVNLKNIQDGFVLYMLLVMLK